jgi:hypothetical protein
MINIQHQEDEVISQFLNSIGIWRDFVVIGGGFALFIYKLYLADPKLENSPIGTRDLDSLIPRKAPKISTKDLSKHLYEAGFIHVFKDIESPATESYVKEINSIEVEIEFLTDSSVRNDKNKNVVIAGVVAQPLRYLTLSLQTTIEFQTYSQKKGRVVSPGAWMFHKGLTFPRRKSSLKMLKDLYGIWYVATQLGEFSDQAITELHMLSKIHSKWFKTFKQNIHRWVANASPFDWLKLEAQDPSGKLKKLFFIKTVEKIMREFINASSGSEPI